jgi:hypothetical protein
MDTFVGIVIHESRLDGICRQCLRPKPIPNGRRIRNAVESLLRLEQCRQIGNLAIRRGLRRLYGTHSRSGGRAVDPNRGQTKFLRGNDVVENALTNVQDAIGGRAKAA